MHTATCHALLVMRLLLCMVMSSWLLASETVSAQLSCSHYASPAGGSNGLSQKAPFRIVDFWRVARPGSTLCLLDGTYTQDGIQPPQGLSGSPGKSITVKALNDGGVYINGQFQRTTLRLQSNSWFVIEGIDVGNSAFEAMSLYPGSHHNIIRRVCAWNANRPIEAGGGGKNLHVAGFWNASDNLMEDICAFGYGRNTYGDFERAALRNTVRRAWFRWDGWPDGNGATCPGPTIQASYHTFGSGNVLENIIDVFSGGLYNRNWPHPDGFPCRHTLGAGSFYRDGIHDGGQGYSNKGYIGYGYSTNADILVPGAAGCWSSRWVPNQYQDMFCDTRWAGGAAGKFSFGCDLQFPDESYQGGRCDLQHIDRLTQIKPPGGPDINLWGGAAKVATNIANCTDPANCPNFFTGMGPGGTQGARNCFRYQDGQLTTTPLWPWPMDDRIKQALQRSGIGPTLAGTAGLGYAANTVTSEIVSRYGPIPSACLGSGDEHR
jgi:hypothetical protein